MPESDILSREEFEDLFLGPNIHQTREKQVMAHDRAQRELLAAKEELLRCALLNIEQLQTGCNSLRRERDQWKAGERESVNAELHGIAENAMHLLRSQGFYSFNPNHPIWKRWGEFSRAEAEEKAPAQPDVVEGLVEALRPFANAPLREPDIFAYHLFCFALEPLLKAAKRALAAYEKQKEKA